MVTTLHKYSAFLLTSACLMIAAGGSLGEPAAADAKAITSAVEEFHKAMAAGKSDKVMSLLLPDALVVEGGAVQTRSEYQSAHLAEDIAYARAVPGKQVDVVVRQEGDVAWVTSTFEVKGKFQDNPVNSLVAETMLLTKTPAGWRIRAIHWSSHSRR